MNVYLWINKVLNKLIK